MTAKSSEGQRTFSHRVRRALIGGAVSLGLFVLARLLAACINPIGAYPFANLGLFLGTPFLLLSFIVPGSASLGIAGATAIYALSWFVVGALLGLMIRRPSLVAVAWLLVAGGLAAIAFAALMLGMMSSSP